MIKLERNGRAKTVLGQRPGASSAGVGPFGVRCGASRGRFIPLSLLMLLILSFSTFGLTTNIDGNPAKATTGTTARIEWTTDELSTSRVDYGLTNQLGQFVESQEFTRFHSVTIEGLDPNNRYYFQMMSIAASGEFRVANNNGNFYQFTTNPGSDALPPSFADIKATAFSASSTTFQWKTNEPATTELWFGEFEPYELNSDSAKVTEHVVSIPTDSGRMYTVIVGGCDSTGNCANATPTRVLAGEQSGVPQLSTNLKEAVNQNRIDVTGITRPYSTVDVFVNNIRQRTVTSEGNGAFKAANIVLPKTENIVKIVVTDAAGNQVEQEYPVRLDTVPPRVTLSTIPVNSINTPLTITGTANEPVNVTYEVQQAFDTTAPSRVAGLKTDDVRANSVKLSWTQSGEADLHEYSVYRDGVRIATTQQNTYTDATSSNKVYNYRVSALDKSCNEGQLTDSLLVQTPSGGTAQSGMPTEAPVTCTPQKQSLISTTGQFSFAANLQEGNNQIRVTVEDIAGNKVVIQNSTRFDKTAPKFLEDNLAKLSPTYIPEVTVKGRLSEPGTVFVYVNGASKHQTFTTTDEQGYFEVKVLLQRSVTADGKTTTVNNPAAATTQSALNNPTGNLVLETGIGGFPNKIRLEAVDLSGQKVSKEATIRYELCGEGTWFKVDVGEVSPSAVTPRLVIEGVQQVGFPVNISYRGLGNVTLRRAPTVTPVSLSLGEADEWDNGLIRINPIFPRKADKGNIAGYVQLLFNKQDVGIGQTTSAKEKELSEHRKDDECKTPGVGCVRFFLQLEIEAQEEIPKRATDPRIDQTTGNVNVENIRQRVCMPIELQMDVPINLGEKVPKKFLEQTSSFLSSGIDVIDGLLKPLTTIGTYTLYGCFAMSAVNFVMYAIEEYTCTVSSVSGSVSGSGGFKREIAEIGACDIAYPTSDSSKAASNNACKKCQNAIEERVSVETVQRTTCDRVACPSAPTLQTYIGDMQRRGVKGTGLTDDQGRTIYAGSSCGFNNKDIQYETTEFEHLADFRPGEGTLTVGFGYESIKSQYIAFQNHKDDQSKKESQVPGTSLGVNCAGLHPANPECCSTEYYNEWGSACGIPGLVETFDELEQSACLSAQKANQLKDFEKEASEAKKSPVTCNSLFNAVAGFCEPNSGKPVSEWIPTRIFYGASPTQSAPTREIYVEVRPVPAEDPKTYEVWRGYVFQSYVEQKLPPGQQIANKDNIRYLDEKNSFYPDKDLTTHFVNKDGPIKAGDVTAFIHAFCDDVKDNGVCNSRAKSVYDQIISKITVPDKTYIVRPEGEGILRSVQCVCLPAVTSYLSFWRNVMVNVKTCVDHTRLTGEGSSGVCKAVLSQYVCDMLYDFLRCFMQKFGSPGAGGRTEGGGVGDVLGSLTRAGSRMEQSVQGRYGQSALWQTMFTEKKLLHGICAFAFTGQWDLDVEGLFQQTVNDIPVQSMGLIYPADRRYVAYDPTTKPTGLTTWVYHFGVGLMAGSDLRFQMTLKCSNSLKCETKDGFKDGKCDCFGKQEKTMPVIVPELGTGQLRKNDVLNSEIFYTIQAQNTGSEVRYDTAILEWEYTDAQKNVQKGKVEKYISLTGSDAPNFCKIELLDSPFYLCKFNVGDYAGAALKDATLASPNVLLETKQATFNVPVNLFAASDPRTQGSSATGPNTKFLIYELRNGNGILVSTNKNAPVTVNTEGEKSYTVTTETISKAMFGSSSTLTRMTELLSAASESMPNPVDTRGYAVTLVNNDQSSFTLTTGVELILVLKGTTVDVYRAASVERYAAWKATGSNPLDANDWGYWKKGQLVGTGQLSGSIITINGPLNGAINPNDRVQIALRTIPQAAGEKYPEFFLRYTIGGGTATTCDRFKLTPDKWVATFTLYDSKKPVYGGAYEPNFDQVTTDAEGNRQTKAMQVDAICAPTYTAPAGTGVAGFPPTFRFCSIDPTVANTQSCFCGSDSDALFLLRTNAFENSYNCGPGSVGNYCGYTEGGRTCTLSPLASVPVLMGISYRELSPLLQPTGVVVPVQNKAATLKAGVNYEVLGSAYYPSPYTLAYETASVGTGIGLTGKAENALIQRVSSTQTTQFLVSYPAGLHTDTATVEDAVDGTKRSVWTIKVTAQ